MGDLAQHRWDMKQEGLRNFLDKLNATQSNMIGACELIRDMLERTSRAVNEYLGFINHNG